MSKMKTMPLLLILISVTTTAQTNYEDTDKLKLYLKKYADSNCSNQEYLKSITELMGRLNSKNSKDLTVEQRKANDQIMDATQSVRDGLAAGIMGKKEDCAQKINNGIDKLKVLPTKPKSSREPIGEELPVHTDS